MSNVIELPKKIYWTDHLDKLEIGESFSADYKQYQKSITSLISGNYRFKNPLKRFKTAKEQIKGIDHLTVLRLQDVRLNQVNRQAEN